MSDNNKFFLDNKKNERTDTEIRIEKQIKTDRFDKVRQKAFTNINRKGKIAYKQIQVVKHSRKPSQSKLSQSKLIVSNPKKQPSQSLSNSKNIKSHSRQASSIIHTNNNDYCVNEYFVINKHKPKQDKKSTLITNPTNNNPSYYLQDNYYYDHKQSKSEIQLTNQQYGIQVSRGQTQKSQRNQHQTDSNQQSKRLTAMMKKLTLNQNTHAINENGKIIQVKKHTHTKSNSKNLTNSFSQNTLSFSKQYLDKNPNKSKSKSKHKMNLRSKQMKKPQNKLQSNKEKLMKKHKQKQISVHDAILMKSKSVDKISSQYANIFEKIPKKNNKEMADNKCEMDRKTKQHIRYQSAYFPINYTSSTTINNQSSSLSSSSSTSSLKLNQNYISMIKIDWKQVADQIKTEIQMSDKVYRRQKQFVKNKQLLTQRIKCINLIAKICNQLKTKRDTYYLSIHYFDKYILNYQTPNKKAIALTSIMIALKIDYSQLLSKYISSFRPNPQITIKKTNKTHKKKKSQLNNSSSSSSLLKNKDSVIQPKDILSFLVTIPIYDSDKKDPYAQDKQEDFHIGEIINIETEIMSRLKFRFYTKTYGYWIDLLTTMWDQYMMGIVSNNLRAKGDKQDKQMTDDRWVFFKRSAQSMYVKTQREQKLFSFLVQSCQSSFMHPFNKLCPVKIVVSVMYILLRLHVQQSRCGNALTIYRYYRQELGRSCNLIFCDSTGMNEIFGNFLSRINLSMAVIVESIAFVSKLINVEEFKVWNYRQQFGQTYYDRLSSFILNQKLFPINKNK